MPQGLLLGKRDLRQEMNIVHNSTGSWHSLPAWLLLAFFFPFISSKKSYFWRDHRGSDTSYGYSREKKARSHKMHLPGLCGPQGDLLNKERKSEVATASRPQGRASPACQGRLVDGSASGLAEFGNIILHSSKNQTKQNPGEDPLSAIPHPATGKALTVV